MRITPEDYELLLRRQNPAPPQKLRRVMRPWTSSDDARLRDLYPLHGAKKIGDMMNRGTGAVRDRCSLLGLKDKARSWTPEEIEALRETYRLAPPLRLAELAARLIRDKANVCRKARELGLTNQRRPKVVARKRRRMFDSPDERRAYMSKIRTGRPNPMKGKRGTPHTAEVRAKLSEISRRAWANPASGLNSEAVRQQRSDHMMALRATGQLREGYTRCAGGRREDLGNQYFRSSWEANYARYLMYLRAHGKIAGWTYEAKTFLFEQIKRGTRSYTPDFRVEHTDGRHEWHEVKGWMDQPSRTRLARMAKYYPAETVVIIGREWFRQAERGGLAGVLPGWERRRR